MKILCGVCYSIAGIGGSRLLSLVLFPNALAILLTLKLQIRQKQVKSFAFSTFVEFRIINESTIRLTMNNCNFPV